MKLLCSAFFLFGHLSRSCDLNIFRILPIFSYNIFYQIWVYFCSYVHMIMISFVCHHLQLTGDKSAIKTNDNKGFRHVALLELFITIGSLSVSGFRSDFKSLIGKRGTYVIRKSWACLLSYGSKQPCSLEKSSQIKHTMLSFITFADLFINRFSELILHFVAIISNLFIYILP